MGEYVYGVTSIYMNEGFYEDALIEFFTDYLGYEHLYGPDVRRTNDKYDDVFLPDVLPEALQRVNPGMPYQAIREAILKISNVEAGGLEQRNKIFSDYLQPAVEVRYFDGTEDRDDTVRLLDFIRLRDALLPRPMSGEIDLS